MMFTGTPQELAEQEQKARVLLDEIAARLNELEAIAPGSVGAHNGEISGLGASIRSRFNGPWEVVEAR